MNVKHLAIRLAAEPPEILVYDRLAPNRIVHAVRDAEGEPRREVFVMSSYTWSRVEHTAAMITSKQIRIRMCEQVGALVHGPNGTTLILPLPTPVTAAMIDMEADSIPPITPRREWRIEL